MMAADDLVSSRQQLSHVTVVRRIMRHTYTLGLHGCVRLADGAVKWASWHIRPQAIRLIIQQLVQATVKDVIKTLHYWHIESIGDQWVRDAESASMSWRHNG